MPVLSHCFKRLSAFSLSILATLFSIPINADEAFRISSSVQNWSASFQLANAQPIEIVDRAKYFKFFSKTPDGLWLSIHVEHTDNKYATHASCKQQYLIDVQKLALSETINSPTFEQVFYEIDLLHKGQKFKMKHTNIYKTFRNFCLDLHIAATPGFRNFDQTVHAIKYSFKLEDLITAESHMILPDSTVASR